MLLLRTALSVYSRAWSILPTTWAPELFSATEPPKQSYELVFHCTAVYGKKTVFCATRLTHPVRTSSRKLRSPKADFPPNPKLTEPSPRPTAPRRCAPALRPAR